MARRAYHLHDGKKGAALGVRVVPRADRNEIVEVLRDGVVRIRLNAPPREDEMNRTLVEYLAEVLDVSKDRIEIVAGESGRDKLVSITDMDAKTAQQRILQSLA